jgi:hypothetical protein
LQRTQCGEPGTVRRFGSLKGPVRGAFILPAILLRRHFPIFCYFPVIRAALNGG